MLALLRTAVRRPPSFPLPLYANQRPRAKSTITHHAASPEAAREVPTPLVLVSADRWSGEQTSMSAFVKHFTTHGWNVACIDLDPVRGGDQDVSSCTTSAEVLSRLEGELAAQMRNSGSPFPPMLVASGLTSLVAEAYVSSHPLSALALLDPPLTPEEAHQRNPDRLPTPLEPFTYELRFPSLVAWSAARAKQLAFFEVHRIEEAREEEADEALDRYVWDLDSAETDAERAGPDQLRKWAEDSGMGANNAQALAPEEDGAEESDEGETEKESEKESDEEAEEEATEATAGTTKKRYTPPTPPDWFVQGKYVRNPERAAKKYPLFLDESHLREAFIRGSGPGGQAINKLATCVQLTHIPTGLQFRSQETRSRPQNRDIARRRLSRELELLVFGERDSVLGREAAKARQKEHKKSQKRRRKERIQVTKDSMTEKFFRATEDEILASRRFRG